MGVGVGVGGRHESNKVWEGNKKNRNRKGYCFFPYHISRLFSVLCYLFHLVLLFCINFFVVMSSCQSLVVICGFLGCHVLARPESDLMNN